MADDWISFGPFEFDQSTGELRKSGKSVPIRPKAAKVLALLLKHRGQVITREQLQRKIWGSTVVDFDQNLNFCIRQIRIALEDDVREPAYLQTLPRIGYRFIDSPNRRYPIYIACGVSALLATIVGIFSAGSMGYNEMPGVNRDPAPVSGEYSEIYDAYNRGRTVLEKLGSNIAPGSIQHFQDAIEMDPFFAPAYAALAQAYVNPNGARALSLPKARSMAARAIDINPDLVQAHLALGHVYWWDAWDLEAAERKFLEAARLDNDSAATHRSLALLKLAQGDPDAAVQWIDRSLRGNLRFGLDGAIAGWVFYGARDYDRAIDYCELSLDVHPNSEGAIQCLILANYQMNNLEASVNLAEQLLHATGREDLLPLTGDDEVEKLRRFWKWELGRYSLAPVSLAARHALLGNKRAAIELLNQALEQRSRRLFFVNAHPHFDILRGEPDFQAVVARIRSYSLS